MLIFSKTLRAGETAPEPGALQLRLTGFAQQGVLSVEQVIAALDRLPAFHLAGLREIAYLTQAQVRIEQCFLPNAAWTGQRGKFDQSRRRIALYGIDEAALFLHVLYHEIGHFVFFLVISSTVKKRWVTCVSGRSPYPSAYAATSAAEDFAETYACFLLTPQRLDAMPEKYRFMREQVFSGASGTRKEKAASHALGGI